MAKPSKSTESFAVPPCSSCHRPIPIGVWLDSSVQKCPACEANLPKRFLGSTCLDSEHFIAPAGSKQKDTVIKPLGSNDNSKDNHKNQIDRFSRKLEGSLEVATWMLEEMKKRGNLKQQKAAQEIKTKFGNHYLYWNKNGNAAIRAEVLNIFRTLTKESVVWDKDKLEWRHRNPRDPVGRVAN